MVSSSGVSVFCQSAPIVNILSILLTQIAANDLNVYCDKWTAQNWTFVFNILFEDRLMRRITFCLKYALDTLVCTPHIQRTEMPVIENWDSVGADFVSSKLGYENERAGAISSALASDTLPTPNEALVLLRKVQFRNRSWYLYFWWEDKLPPQQVSHLTGLFQHHQAVLNGF